VQVLSNSQWQAKIKKLARLAAMQRKPQKPDQDQHNSDQHQDQLCACGCGETVRPGRTFVSQAHQVRWLKAGGATTRLSHTWDKPQSD
jgi:hypothetical protein